MSKAVKNIIALILGQFFNLALNLISISLAARYLGVELFGRFSALLAIITVVSKLFDFGFPSVVFREMSLRHKDYKYLNSAIFVTIVAYLISAICLNLVMIILSLSITEMVLLNLLLFNTLLSAKFNNMRELLNTPFKVNLSMYIPMMIVILDNFIFLILVILMPFLNVGLTYFILGYVLSNLPGFFILSFYLARKFNFRFSFELGGGKWLFKEALPLYGYLILDALFQQLDIILIKYFHGDYEVGIYSVAIRLVFPLLVIPYAVIQTVFPRIVQNISSFNNQNERVIIIVYKILFGFAVLISIMFTYKSQAIIDLLFGMSFEKSALPTSILLWLQIFIYYNYFTINLFLAYNKQTLIFRYAVLVLVINIALNLILIPQTSFLGASIAKMVAASLGSIYIMISHYKLKLKLYLPNLRMLIWVVMIIPTSFLSGYLPLMPYFILSLIMIFFSMIFVKYFNKDEIFLLFELINRPRWAKHVLKFY